MLQCAAMLCNSAQRLYLTTSGKGSARVEQSRAKGDGNSAKSTHRAYLTTIDAFLRKFAMRCGSATLLDPTPPQVQRLRKSLHLWWSQNSFQNSAHRLYEGFFVACRPPVIQGPQQISTPPLFDYRLQGTRELACSRKKGPANLHTAYI